MRPLREGLPLFCRSRTPCSPSSPRVGEEGGKGEGKERQGVLRSTGPETVKTLCHRVAETHALPATISLTIMAMS